MSPPDPGWIIMAARSNQVRRLGFRAAALLAGMMAFAPVGRADVSVSEPQPGLLVVEAHNATIDEVLAEIGRSQKMQLESAAPLAGVISGTYRGPLSRVLVRLLDGYNVVIRTSAAGLQVRVFKPGDKVRVAAPSANFGMPLHPAVSSNVDADEQKTLAATAPPPAPAAPPPRRGPAVAPAVLPSPHVLAAGPTVAPLQPKVSSNLDADEERGGN
jgi:hypothetical protein